MQFIETCSVLFLCFALHRNTLHAEQQALTEKARRRRSVKATSTASLRISFASSCVLLLVALPDSLHLVHMMVAVII